jgi:hypothetical protein
LGDKAHKVNGVGGISGISGAEFGVLGGDSGGAGIEMADAHHDTAEGDEGAVENPNSSAPRRAAIAMSRPVLSCPSVSTTIRLRRLLRTRV